jgi:hypothetical protein
MQFLSRGYRGLGFGPVLSIIRYCVSGTGVLALLVAFHAFRLDAIKERPQLFVATKFDALAVSQLLRAPVDVIKKLLPPLEQLDRFVQSLAPVVKDAPSQRVLDELLVLRREIGAHGENPVGLGWKDNRN